MERHHRAIVLSVMLATLSIAAGPPVALLVETAAIRPEGDATLVSVTVQVAPEDRSRLGRDVWVQGELLRRGQRVNRLARALDLDDRGQAAFEVAWPPGDYELRVSIAGATGKVGGIWVGPLAVPVLTSEVPPAAAAPVAATAAAAAVAVTQPTTAEPVPQSEIAPPAEAVPEPVAEPFPAQALPVVPTVAAAAAAAAVAATKPPETEPAPQPEIAAPAEAVPEPAAEPSAAEALPAAAARPAGTAGSWAAAHPAMADVTVVVTERNRPILGLGTTAFRLRVGGSEVTVEAVGDAASAPLNLAVVADLSPDAGELVDEVASQLGRFSIRTRDGGDLLVATTAEPRPSWGAGPDSFMRWADATAEGRPDDLAGLVTAAAQAVAGRRGRSFLVVVTDGGDASGKAAWKDASAAAEAAGVPVFVIGLRDSGFDDQARSGLGRVAEATGGRSYFLGSAGMAGMTLDYLGELIDASYALAFRPPGSGPGPREVKVEVVNRDWQVDHSRRIP